MNKANEPDGSGKIIEGLPDRIIDSHQRGQHWYLLCGPEPRPDGDEENYTLHLFSGRLPEKREAVFEFSNLGLYTPLSSVPSQNFQTSSSVPSRIPSRRWPRISVSPEGHTVSLLTLNSFGLVSRPAAVCMADRTVHYFSNPDVNVSAECWLNEKEILWAQSHSHQLMKTVLPQAGLAGSIARPPGAAETNAETNAEIETETKTNGGKWQQKVYPFARARDAASKPLSAPFYAVGLDRRTLQLRGPDLDFSFSFDLNHMTAEPAALETEKGPSLAPWYFDPANSLSSRLPDGRSINHGYDQYDEWVDVSSADGGGFRVDYSAWYYSHLTTVGLLPAEKSGLNETLLVSGDTAGQVVINILDDNKALEKFFIIHSHTGRVSRLAADAGLLVSAGLDHLVGLSNMAGLYPPWETPRGSAVPSKPAAKELPYHAVGGVSGRASPFTFGDLEPTAYLYANGKGGYLIWTADGYFMGTRDLFGSVGWYLNPPEGRSGRIVPFEQLQLHFNRPDVVLARLGIHDDRLIHFLSQIHQQRLRRLGLQELFSFHPADTPEIEIYSPHDGRTTTETSTSIQITRGDSSAPLAWAQVYLNGVPLFGESGHTWPEKENRLTLEIDLLDGRNVIDVSAFSSLGVESFRRRAIVNRQSAHPQTGTETDRGPNLYLVTVGVSEYEDERYSLEYAHKDGIDIVDFFNRAPGGYEGVRSLMIHNRDAVRENIMKAADFFSAAGRNDTVILYMAGHGLRDQEGNYYFGTSDIDFTLPEKRGLPFDAIDSLFWETPAVNRFIFMDTCFSGEEALTEYLSDYLSQTAPGVTDSSGQQVSARSFPNPRGIIRVSDDAVDDGAADGTHTPDVDAAAGEPSPEKSSADLDPRNYSFIRDNLYANISYRSGATVFASSAGHEVSFEDERYRNGLYTYAVLSSLAAPETDTNGDGVISTSELQAALTRLLRELSGGLQSPTVTPGRIGYDPALYSRPPRKTFPAQQ